MKIYDCLTFNDENEILEVRLNELSKYVDYFIIIESGETHQGTSKKTKIRNDLIEKFKSKVRYYFINNFDKKFGPWQRESYQRDYIKKGLFDAKESDIIIVSDVDEIPNLKNFNFNNVKDTVFAFKQIHTMYKFNLIRTHDWLGSKLCSYKILKSPQWLRSLKVHKKYNFFRIDKYFANDYYSKFKIIENGGWHFGWLKNASEIITKLESYAHFEHNNLNIKNYEYINDCIKKNISFLNNSEFLKLENDLDKFPRYIKENSNRFKEYIK